MPNRIIREGWIDSDPINTLDASAERFFLRLCLRADDFGRFHGNPLLLKASLFPLIEGVRSGDIPKLLATCENAGLLDVYEVDGKRFIQIRKFGQRSRANTSKFPQPPADVSQASVICQTNDSHPRTYSDSETYSKTEAEVRPAPAGASSVEIPMLLNTPEFIKAWDLWKRHRAEIKHPLRPTSEQAALNELELMGSDRAIKAITHTIAKGWRGLREPSEAFQGFNSKPQQAERNLTEIEVNSDEKPEFK